MFVTDIDTLSCGTTVSWHLRPTSTPMALRPLASVWRASCSCASCASSSLISRPMSRLCTSTSCSVANQRRLAYSFPTVALAERLGQGAFLAPWGGAALSLARLLELGRALCNEAVRCEGLTPTSVAQKPEPRTQTENPTRNRDQHMPTIEDRGRRGDGEDRPVGSLYTNPGHWSLHPQAPRRTIHRTTQT